jgi:hypothetical protein
MKTLQQLTCRGLFALMAFALLAGCDPGSNDDGKNCYQVMYIGVTNVTGPETVALGQPIVLAVNYLVENQCGNFKDFYVEANGAYDRTLTLQAEYNGCNCPIGQVSKSINYSFTPAVAGTYTFRFKVDATTQITKVVTVN